MRRPGMTRDARADGRRCRAWRYTVALTYAPVLRPTILALGLAASLASPAAAQETDTTVQAQDLKRLSIEELARIDVTSVSRRPEQLSHTAAAVSVVTQEDVHRAGAVMLAEALRLADGIDVGRVNGGTWAVSVRGFNINSANKLLVLIDGRSTYSSLFGGTFWDTQDMVLDDLDRIEVVRGPGGTMWGANAVNGVVNVITKAAADTQGSLVSVVAGDNDRAIVSGRYGGQLGTGHYRVYGKYRMREPQTLASGQDAGDDLRFGQAGFRFDSNQSGAHRWSVFGDMYKGTNGFPDRPDGDVSGGNIVGRWSRRAGEDQFSIQSVYERSYRKVPLQFEETRHAGEIDVQQAMTRGRHRLMFGSTLRGYRSDDLGTAGFRFEPQVRNGWMANAFAQDEIELLPGRAYLTLGSKFGRNSFTGFEAQPNARIRVHPDERQMAWAAISRAVRLPTRFDNDIRLVNPVTGALVLTASDAFEAERVVAVEAGYRVQPHARVALDAAVFTNDYDRLRSQDLMFTPAPLFVLGNGLNARASGVEVAGSVQLAANWRMHGSYAWLHKELTFDPESTDPTGGVFEGNDPSHLAAMRSHLDLPRGLAFDVGLRYVGERPTPVVESYAGLDARIGWRATPAWELSIIGHSLLHARHQEMASPSAPRYAFRRSIFARSTWSF
jgi:iron complex outermembrane receptor protein